MAITLVAFLAFGIQVIAWLFLPAGNGSKGSA